MQKLTADNLMTLETYARERDGFRKKVMAHKKHRQLALGNHVTLYFEDRLTMQYQVQEMLRTERIFEPDGIREELDAYNPLIPDGTNFKATMMIEYTDVDERREALARLVGIEHKVYARVGDDEHVWAIADEDLERADAEKTSSVHFLRFELSPAMIAAAKNGAPIAFGIAHDRYKVVVDPVDTPLRDSLVNDLA